MLTGEATLFFASLYSTDQLLALLYSKQSKLHRVLATLSAIGLKEEFGANYNLLKVDPISKLYIIQCSKDKCNITLFSGHLLGLIWYAKATDYMPGELQLQKGLCDTNLLNSL